MPHHRPSDLFLSREAEEEKARAAAPGRDSEREAEAKAAAILKRAEEQRLAAEKAAVLDTQHLTTACTRVNLHAHLHLLPSLYINA
jgi:hypothetical protein